MVCLCASRLHTRFRGAANRPGLRQSNSALWCGDLRRMAPHNPRRPSVGTPFHPTNRAVHEAVEVWVSPAHPNQFGVMRRFPASYVLVRRSLLCRGSTNTSSVRNHAGDSQLGGRYDSPWQTRGGLPWRLQLRFEATTTGRRYGDWRRRRGMPIRPAGCWPWRWFMTGARGAMPAEIGGVGLQTVRDWVLAVQCRGPGRAGERQGTGRTGPCSGKSGARRPAPESSRRARSRRCMAWCAGASST